MAALLSSAPIVQTAPAEASIEQAGPGDPCPDGYHASADATACVPTVRWSPMSSPLEGQLAFHDEGSASAELNGKLYVLGGLNRDHSHTPSDVRSYDPATHTWTTLGPDRSGARQ